ncbi:FAD-dependent monooxygenase [Rugosimonospora africana]|uniref:2-polyprenyl-6-methoxyphenol hydroxylase n=1 Tax=Rugosimonospora africana TaxID=556532 RepID=A0A8J3VSD6_9ACTN|nr:FAD-dependent monooxygenase [Rugosimonospora africana]GIH16348.1 2-polyprenyl-6-methoxyphenol hydroxylase [Rugosimonospora africana]
MSHTAPSDPAAAATGTPPPSAVSRPRVAIVGGSVTGPAAALLLLHAGFDVSVYEAAGDSAPQGGGLIGLEHASLDVLDQLGIEQSEFVKYDSEVVAHIAVRERRPARARRHRYAGRNTTWPLLHAALARRLPAGVLHTGATVTGLSDYHGQPLLHFADGQRRPVDLVVFADGRASVGRQLLDGGRRLRYAGYVAHRGQVAGPVSGLRDFLRFQPVPEAGVQLTVAPIPGGADWTFYLGATAAQYTRWFGAPPTRRLFALPHHVGAAARARVDEAARRYLPEPQATLVAGTTDRMAAPVMDIDPPTRMVWPLRGGHAVLLGDALAPVRPHTARGANNGIEQAAGLVAALTQHRKYGADLATALEGWQRRHLPAALAAVAAGPVLGRHIGFADA